MDVKSQWNSSEPLRHKKRPFSGSRKKCFDNSGSGSNSAPAVRGKAEKRTKRKKYGDSSKRLKHDYDRDVESLNRSPNSQSPECDIKMDFQSPFVDDSQEGVNSSQEASESLCMSTLLKSILDEKKMMLLESPEVLQFFKCNSIKQEELLQ